MQVVAVGDRLVDLAAQLAALGQAGRVRAELGHARAPVAAVPDDLLDAHAAGEGLRLTEAIRSEEEGDQLLGGAALARDRNVERPVHSAALGVQGGRALAPLLTAVRAPEGAG